MEKKIKYLEAKRLREKEIQILKEAEELREKEQEFRSKEQQEITELKRIKIKRTATKKKRRRYQN